MRSGVKMTETQVVAYSEGTARLDDLQRVAEAAFMKLVQDARAAGLTPLPQYSLQIDLPQTMDGSTMVTWEAGVPVVNEVPQGGGAGGVKVKAVEPAKVAYTFHQGGLEGVELTLQLLIGYMMQNGQLPGQKITFVAQTDPQTTKVEDIILELRVAVQTG
jgi:effector-binding domain-containing protein